MSFKSILENRLYQKIFGYCIVIFWLFIFYQKIDLPEKIGHRPTGEHIWAQIDRASMALSYYNDLAPFLLPRCHRATNNMEGITAGEFPLIPYSVSKLYGLFGFNELYHRLFVLCLSIIGFIFCFLLAYKLLNSYYWAAFCSIIWIASPNIIYYSISFLPEVPVLAFITISIFFLFRNTRKPSVIDLFLFGLFFSLACLVRVSAAFPLTAISLAYFISYRNSKLIGLQKKIGFGIAVFIPFILSICWVYYSKWIVSQYHIHTFLMNPVPPLSFSDFKDGLKIFIARYDLFYINGFFYLIIAATLPALVYIRRSNKFLLLTTCFTYLSFLVLFLILFKQGIEHSYYWIPFQIGLFFHFAWLADMASKIKVSVSLKLIIIFASMIFINYNAIHIEKNFRKRWIDGKDKYLSYYDLEGYLNSLNITYKDRIVTYADPTFNNTLYLMNRKGWALAMDDSPDRMQRAFSSCDYAVLNDTTLIQNPFVNPYIGNQIGFHKGLYIYELLPSK